MILIGSRYHKLNKIKYFKISAILCTVKKRNCFQVGELKYLYYALEIVWYLVQHLVETYYNSFFKIAHKFSN